MKDAFCTATGLVFGWIASAMGGWDMAATTLFYFMMVDYITGIIVAGVFHKSKKTNTGSLKSLVGFKGLCRKFIQLALVAVGYRMDLLLGTNYIREAIALAFIANECLSIIENAGLMGIPLPAVLVKAVDVLSEKANVENLEEQV
jgi:toxin secretion/phage lysis holin